MKHSTDRFISHTKTPAVAVESDRKMLTLTIKIPVRGAVLAMASRHQERLKDHVRDLVGEVLATPRPHASVRRLAETLHATAKTTESPAVRTKQPKNTIGVVSAVHLWSTIDNEAEDRDETVAEVARDLFERGLNRFEERLWIESSKVVLEDFERAYEHFRADETTKQWSLRIPRRVYLQSVLLAREYGLSQSKLACWCLSVGLETEVEA